MNKSLLNNFLIVLCKVIFVCSVMLVSIVITRVFGVEKLGLYVTFVLYSGFASLIFLYGNASKVLYYLPGNAEYVVSYLKAIFKNKLIIASYMMLVIVVFSYIIHIKEQEIHLSIIVLTVFSMVSCLTYNSLFLNVFNSIKQPVKGMLLFQVLPQLCLIFYVSIFYFFDEVFIHYQFEWLLVASYLTAIVISLPFILSSFEIKLTSKYNKLSYFKGSWSYFLGAVSFYLLGNTDLLIVTRVFGQEQIAAYSLAVKFNSLVLFANVLVNSSFIPNLRVMLKERKSIKNLIYKYTLLIFLFSIFVSIVVYIPFDFWIGLWDSSLYDYYSTFIILGVAGIVQSLFILTPACLLCTNRQKENAKIEFVTFVLNLILSLSLLYFVGVNGVALATLISVAIAGIIRSLLLLNIFRSKEVLL
ncbi:polysaccharide biosynthesis C-terminal domain-containing protein [Photobacterium rosenbergii]|nr:polysaccharide biosynthesis C-terminal domain-containing protein [Photobacterium rosenbergii]